MPNPRLQSTLGDLRDRGRFNFGRRVLAMSGDVAVVGRVLLGRRKQHFRPLSLVIPRRLRPSARPHTVSLPGSRTVHGTGPI